MMTDIGKYEEVPKDKIVANSWNPNVMTDKEEEKLGENIDRNGFLQTVLLYKQQDGKYMIIDGEHRWKTAKQDKLRSIVLDDTDLEQIKKKLISKGIPVNNKDDVMKALTANMNRQRGTMSPALFGEMISGMEIDDSMKGALLQMEEEELKFYQLVDEIEEEKKLVHEKEDIIDDSVTVKWKVKDVTGLKSVILDIPNKKFMIDGEEKEIESMSMTVGGNLQTTLRARYRDKDVTTEEESQEKPDVKDGL